MIDLNTHDISTSLQEMMDKMMQAGNESQPNRQYIGGSRLGDSCARKLQYEYFNAPRNPFKGSTLRIFYRGHEGELWMFHWLLKCGFVITGTQDGFETANGKIQGHIDGKITSGPDKFGPYPRLWENKVLGSKGCSKLRNHRLKKAYPVYYAQCQLYMAYMELDEHPALFTALNADTMDIYAESIPFDPVEAQRISDRGAMIIQACNSGELLPRLNDDPEYFECKFCDFRMKCHGLTSN